MKSKQQQQAIKKNNPNPLKKHTTQEQKNRVFQLREQGFSDQYISEETGINKHTLKTLKPKKKSKYGTLEPILISNIQEWIMNDFRSYRLKNKTRQEKVIRSFLKKQLTYERSDYKELIKEERKNLNRIKIENKLIEIIYNILKNKQLNEQQNYESINQNNTDVNNQNFTPFQSQGLVQQSPSFSSSINDLQDENNQNFVDQNSNLYLLPQENQQNDIVEDSNCLNNYNLEQTTIEMETEQKESKINNNQYEEEFNWLWNQID